MARPRPLNRQVRRESSATSFVLDHRDGHAASFRPPSPRAWFALDGMTPCAFRYVLER
jgi:hypothetical protein